MTEPGSKDARAEARIEGALRTLGADLEPPLGWQARVLAAATEPGRGWRRWWSRRAVAFSGAVAMAALVLVLVWRPWHRGGTGGELELALDVEHRGGAVRGGAARVGDVVRVAARRGPGHRAIWIYRGGDELIATCPGGAGCSEADGALAATFTIDLVGTYMVVALWSPQPIAAPAGPRDEALAAAEQRGAIRRVESIVVN